jgi:hypothetical protein
VCLVAVVLSVYSLSLETCGLWQEENDCPGLQETSLDDSMYMVFIIEQKYSFDFVASN